MQLWSGDIHHTSTQTAGLGASDQPGWSQDPGCLETVTGQESSYVTLPLPEGCVGRQLGPWPEQSVW